ncbi:FtsQ-type POTRA domain-containing protein [Pelagibacterales bacterium SAG-MED23]|nr:FtsQ-type POTRA domain-containing protein [Pelagibacterales bacterium SAG-MED23]
MSSIFNFQFLEGLQEKFILKKISIKGLSNNEKEMIEEEFHILKNTNIFKLNEKDVLEKLNKFNFLENIYVNKIIPSSLNINLSKTSILGQTLRNGENFYIGKNQKFIKSVQLNELIETATVFGDFEIEEYLNLINILNAHKLDIKNIKNYYYFKNKRWDLLFSNGLTLMLPSKNIEKSIKIYKKMLTNDNFVNAKIIDLRVTNQIILTNSNE